MDVDLDIAASGPDEAEKLRKIVAALMGQVERSMDVQGNAYTLFQTATVLEDKVKDRTTELEDALTELEDTNRELERAKRTAETAQTRLLEAVESVQEGFALFDSDDRLVLCNRKFVSFWGKETRDIPYGTSFLEILDMVVGENLIEDALDLPDKWISERMAHHRNPADPFIIKLADGRWVRVNERVTRDGGVVGIYTDITDIKHQEAQRRHRELAEKSVLLQSSIDNVTQGISVFDKNLELVAWNQRFIELLNLPEEMVCIGMPFEEYAAYNIGRGNHFMVSPEDPEHSLSASLARARRFEPLRREVTLTGSRSIEIDRSPMPGGGFVTTYTDVTESRAAARQLEEARDTLEVRVTERTTELTQLNEQLLSEISERKTVENALMIAKTEAEEANLSKTRFLAAASHDLLQPLNAARLFVTSLVERGLPGKDGVLAGQIDEALRSVEGMLSALLDISKLDAGAVPVQLAGFSLIDLLQRIVDEFTPLANSSGLELRLIPTSALVMSDNRLLGRIVRNLLSNAIRYTPNGRILIGCRNAGDCVRVEVIDTGIGIPQDSLGEIFEEFRQIGEIRRQDDEGVGLGLAIVKRISRILDHPIEVRSEPGKGSAFSIVVPRATEEQFKPVAEKDVGESATSAPSLNVLVIDNDTSILAGMDSLMTGWGYRVFTATNQAQATAIVRSENSAPDMIIVDYHLDNEENGINVARALHRELGDEIPTLMVTADRTEPVRTTAAIHGIHILNKPLRPARLRAMVNHLFLAS